MKLGKSATSVYFCLMKGPYSVPKRIALPSYYPIKDIHLLSIPDVCISIPTGERSHCDHLNPFFTPTLKKFNIISNFGNHCSPYLKRRTKHWKNKRTKVPNLRNVLYCTKKFQIKRSIKKCLCQNKTVVEQSLIFLSRTFLTDIIQDNTGAISLRISGVSINTIFCAVLIVDMEEVD